MPGTLKVATSPTLTLEPAIWQPSSPKSRPSSSSSASRHLLMTNGTTSHTHTDKQIRHNIRTPAAAAAPADGLGAERTNQAALTSQMAMEALLAKYLKEPLHWDSSQLAPVSVKYPPINPSEDEAHRPIAGPSRLSLSTNASSKAFSNPDLNTSSPLTSPSPLQPRAPRAVEKATSGKDAHLSSEKIPLHFPGGLKRTAAGLNNRGNTCYMNSTMQALLHTPPLAHLLLTRDVDQLKGRFGGNIRGFDPVKALQSLTERALKGSASVTVPSEFIKNLRVVAKTFHQGRQEDAHEWLRLLMESVQQACLASASTEVKKSALKETTFIQRIFGGKLLSRVTCLSCHHNSDTFDPILDLSLDIRGCENLAQAMGNFTQIDELRGSEKYKCEKCKKLVVARKQFTLEKCPEVLTVHLKRFTFTGSKMSRAISFPETLKISSSWTSNRHSGPTYTLYAVVHHHGGGPHSGHYVAEVKSPSGVWCEMNDDFVSQQRQGPGGGSSRSAYILFYVKDARSQLDGVINGKSNGKAPMASPSQGELERQHEREPSASAHAHAPHLSKKAKHDSSDDAAKSSLLRSSHPFSSSSSPNPSTSRFSAANGPRVNGKHNGIGGEIFGGSGKTLLPASRILSQPINPVTFHALATADASPGALSSALEPSTEEDLGEITIGSNAGVAQGGAPDGDDDDDDDDGERNHSAVQSTGSPASLQSATLSKKQRRKLERRRQALLRRSLHSGGGSDCGTASGHGQLNSSSALASASSSSPARAAAAASSPSAAAATRTMDGSGKMSKKDKLRGLASPYIQSKPMSAIFRNYVPSITTATSGNHDSGADADADARVNSPSAIRLTSSSVSTTSTSGGGDGGGGGGGAAAAAAFGTSSERKGWKNGMKRKKRDDL